MDEEDLMCKKSIGNTQESNFDNTQGSLIRE